MKPVLAPPPNATTLAPTCQLLRALSFPFMYASVTAHLESTPALETLLTSSHHIASYIQQLTVFVSDPRGAQLLHRIIGCCTNLQDIRFDGSHASPGFAATLLLRDCSQPHLSLQSHYQVDTGGTRDGH